MYLESSGSELIRNLQTDLTAFRGTHARTMSWPLEAQGVGMGMMLPDIFGRSLRDNLTDKAPPMQPDVDVDSYSTGRRAADLGRAT